MKLNPLFTTLLATFASYAVASRHPEGVAARARSAPGRRGRAAGPVCQGIPAESVSDTQTAEQGLADWFNGVGTWTGAKQSYYWNSAVAFGCNYGGSQSISQDAFMEFMTILDETCGVGSAAFYSDPSSGATYGRTLSSQQFC